MTRNPGTNNQAHSTASRGPGPTDRAALDRQIASAALDAATEGDATVVQALIASSFGARDTRPVGDRPNNHGLMGSSGSYDLKLIELVTNMQDAVLERYALRRWGDPSKVPYSDPHEAAAALLDDPASVGPHPVAVEFRESDPPTGRTKRLTAVFRDTGCGLRPDQLPSTLFQLGGGYKEDRLYLQGAFGLGGAMTYRNAQAVVVVSRRDPVLLGAGEDDRVTVAVVEWQQLTKGASAVYLVDRPWATAGDIALPWSCPAAHVPQVEPGTHLALVSYGVEGLHRGREGDVKSFDTVVNTRLFQPVTPVRFTNHITGRDRSSNLRGLRVRLHDNPNPDRSEGTETLPFNVDGVTYHLPVSYWVFPDGAGARKSFVAADHVVLFLSNGQVHHHWTRADFKARTTLNKLAERALVTVNTDALPIQLRTSLFTADRNDLVRSDPALRLEEAVRAFLDDWDPLREENSRLIREALRSDNSKSTLDLARRISRALTVRGYSLGVGPGSGGGAPGPGGTGGGTGGTRRPVELHPDPTRITGPGIVRAEIGKTRSIPFTVDVVDSFFTDGRGRLAFACDHTGIDAQEIAIGQVRAGRFRVAVAVPDGLKPGIEELRVDLTDWFRVGGGLGDPLTFTTKLELVDALPGTGTGTGKPTGAGAGTSGAGTGGSVAVIWTDPGQTGQEHWHRTTVGEVLLTRAADLAATRPDYADLASLGELQIPVVMLNEEYPPFKTYLSGRSKQLTQLDRPREEYALGVGVNLLLLHEEQTRREQDDQLQNLDDELLHAAHDAAARAVLAVMPSFDELAKQAGLTDVDA